jgi:hypothetical protein
VASLWWLILVILASWKVEIRRITFGSHVWQIVGETPSPKLARAKWTGGVPQVVESLFCKHNALSSNPSPTKKKRRKNMMYKQNRLKFHVTN